MLRCSLGRTEFAKQPETLNVPRGTFEDVATIQGRGRETSMAIRREVTRDKSAVASLRPLPHNPSGVSNRGPGEAVARQQGIGGDLQANHDRSRRAEKQAAVFGVRHNIHGQGKDGRHAACGL